MVGYETGLLGSHGVFIGVQAGTVNRRYFGPGGAADDDILAVEINASVICTGSDENLFNNRIDGVDR